MNKTVLILLYLLTFNIAFSSSKFSNEDLYYAAYGAFTTLANPNEPSELKQEANELLIEYSRENTEFRNQAKKAYRDITEEIVLDSRIKNERERNESLQEINRIAKKLGFEQ